MTLLSPKKSTISTSRRNLRLLARPGTRVTERHGELLEYNKQSLKASSASSKLLPVSCRQACSLEEPRSYGRIGRTVRKFRNHKDRFDRCFVTCLTVHCTRIPRWTQFTESQWKDTLYEGCRGGDARRGSSSIVHQRKP